jgi:muconolactone D-isomerase
MNEYLVRIEVTRPADMSDADWDDLMSRESAHARELYAADTIERMWRVPGTTSNVGVWAAATTTELHEYLSGMPARPYMKIEVQALAQHYLEA